MLNLGKEGDVITLTIVSNEDVTTPTVTFTSGGSDVTNAASVSGSSPGKNYQATYTVHASDIDGAVGFSISDFTDGNNNTGNPVSTLTSGTTITIDKLLPTLTGVTYSTNNSSQYYSKVGDTITLNVSSSEIITAPTIAFSSGGATHTTQTMTGSNQAFTSSYVTQSTHTEGEIGFTISAFDDQAGNTGNNVSAITSGSILYLVPGLPITIFLFFLSIYFLISGQR